MTTAFDRAVQKIASMEGIEDPEDTEFWSAIFRTGLEEFFAVSDDIVTEIAKSLQQSFTGRDDSWDLLDPHRQDRIWKTHAREILNALRQTYSE